MHYVYLENSIVDDQAQVDPFVIFSKEYAAKFIEAPDEVTFGWKKEDGEWIAPPAPPAPDYKEINKQKAKSLLSETDWSQYPDVRDALKTPHLVNGDEFDDYRVALRAIAINPPVTIENWPVKPEEMWSTTV